MGSSTPQSSPCTHTCTRTQFPSVLSLSSQPHSSIPVLCSLSFISPVKLYLLGSLLISPLRFSPPTLPPRFPPFLPPPGIYPPSRALLLQLTHTNTHTLFYLLHCPSTAPFLCVETFKYTRTTVSSFLAALRVTLPLWLKKPLIPER